MNTGDIITRLVSLREERRELSAKDKPLAEEFKELSGQVRERLDDLGLDSIKNGDGRVTLSPVNYAEPTTTMEDVLTWVVETNHFEVLTVRLNGAICKELDEAGLLPNCITLGQRINVNVRSS